MPDAGWLYTPSETLHPPQKRVQKKRGVRHVRNEAKAGASRQQVGADSREPEKRKEISLNLKYLELVG